MSAGVWITSRLNTVLDRKRRAPPGQTTNDQEAGRHDGRYTLCTMVMTRAWEESP